MKTLEIKITEIQAKQVREFAQMLVVLGGDQTLVGINSALNTLKLQACINETIFTLNSLVGEAVGSEAVLANMAATELADALNFTTQNNLKRLFITIKILPETIIIAYGNEKATIKRR